MEPSSPASRASSIVLEQRAAGNLLGDMARRRDELCRHSYELEQQLPVRVNTPDVGRVFVIVVVSPPPP